MNFDFSLTNDIKTAHTNHCEERSGAATSLDCFTSVGNDISFNPDSFILFNYI